jgi:heme A synthase
MFTVIITWLLLIIGGLVNPMAASMACPDWYFFPTCNGEILPRMVGGVLYEHGHRLVASLVGLCTVILTVLCWWPSFRIDFRTKMLSLLALFLIVFQGVLGGVTVLLNLSPVVSTMHLTIAMIFFALLIYISFRLSPINPIKNFEKSLWSILLATILTFIQLIYGGIVRHMGAGLACGDDLISCGPSFWPSWFYGQLHMGHRILGYMIFVTVFYAGNRSYKYARQQQDQLLMSWSFLPLMITCFQIILGVFAIYTIRSPLVLAMHTGFGALLLASLLISCLLPLRAGLSH